MVPVADDDYLSFGYWVQATTDDEGETSYQVAPFATGKMPYNYNMSTRCPDGQATYNGSATGVFVHKTDVNSDGMGHLVPTSSGQFAADVKLTANVRHSWDRWRLISTWHSGKVKLRGQQRPETCSQGGN